MGGADGTDKGAKGGATPRRRERGFRQAGAEVRRPLGAAAARHGFAEPDVLLRWRDIVGEALADLCHPVKVSYGKGPSLGATLTVRAEGAVALQVQHLKDRIIERIHAHYGYRAISAIRITQATGMPGRVPGMAEGQAAFEGPGGRPTPETWRGVPRPPAQVGTDAQRRAGELAAGIRHEGLRDALARMGAHVLSRPGGARGDDT